jgi:RNA polymerase sigma factor (sigma-70 family)
MVGGVVERERARFQAYAAKHRVPTMNVEDIVQTAAVRVLQREELPDTPAEVIQLLLAIIRWEAQTEFRKHARSPEELCAEAEDIDNHTAEPDPERVVLNRDMVRHAVSLLSDAYREVLERAYYADQSVDEIAAALGTSKEDVWQRLSRARVKLREILDRIERDDVDACVVALPLLVLLALFESRSFAPGDDAPILRPDTWVPAVPAVGAPNAPPRITPPGFTSPLGSAGKPALSTALASLGFMAAAAAFALVGDVPVAPAVLGPAAIESVSMVTEARVVELGEAPSRSAFASTPAANSVLAPQPAARPAGPKYDRFLKTDMHSAACRAAMPDRGSGSSTR